MLPGLRSRGWRGATLLCTLIVMTQLGVFAGLPIAPAPAGQAVSAAAPAATNQVYLPLLRGVPEASAQLAAQIDANQNPVNPTNSFTYGITEIFAVMQVHNAAGKPWTVEWYRNGLRIPGTTSTGTFAADAGSVKLVRRFAFANSGVLPASTYKVVLYVDGSKLIEAEAVVTR